MTPHAFLPQGISLYLTYRCQSRCAHCFLVESGKLNNFELSLDQCLAIIDEASDNKVYLMIISGGEPLLHKGFPEVIKYARKRNILPLLGLTGVNVSDDHIRTIVACAIPTVQVSLDGASGTTNDEILGAGNFNEVLSTVARLHKAKLKVNLAICVHDKNLSELDEFFVLAKNSHVARVKLAFYQSVDGTIFSELSDFEKRNVLRKASEFVRKIGLLDWIACPTHDVHSGRKYKEQKRLPPLIIGADGELTSGENGERIGRVGDGPIAVQYSSFVASKKAFFFDSFIRKISRDFDVARILLTDRTISANAIVYKFEGRHEILVDALLPDSVRFFSIAHEIGHIATGTLTTRPRDTRSESAERLANEWALNSMKKNIASDSFHIYLRACETSEDELFRLVRDRLTKDIVNFW